MRTCVRMSLFVVTSPDRPWAVRLTSYDPAEIAEALRAHEGPPLALCASRDGATGPLSPEDKRALEAALGDAFRLEVVTVKDRIFTVAVRCGAVA